MVVEVEVVPVVSRKAGKSEDDKAGEGTAEVDADTERHMQDAGRNRIWMREGAGETSTDMTEKGTYERGQRQQSELTGGAGAGGI